jgi:hypothetical protein
MELPAAHQLLQARVPLTKLFVDFQPYPSPAPCSLNKRQHLLQAGGRSTQGVGYVQSADPAVNSDAPEDPQVLLLAQADMGTIYARFPVFERYSRLLMQSRYVAFHVVVVDEFVVNGDVKRDAGSILHLNTLLGRLGAEQRLPEIPGSLCATQRKAQQAGSAAPQGGVRRRRTAAV